MKSVSFGDLIVRKEVNRLTPHQVKVDDMVGDYLESRRFENGYSTPVVDRVSEDMFSDILLIHKKDGSSQLKIVDDAQLRKEKGISWFNIAKKDRKSLTISAKSSDRTIQNKLSRYAGNLILLCDKYFGKLVNDSRYYKDVPTEEQEAALDAIYDDDDID